MSMSMSIWHGGRIKRWAYPLASQGGFPPAGHGDRCARSSESGNYPDFVEGETERGEQAEESLLACSVVDGLDHWNNKSLK